MYAIVRAGGRQEKVSVGSELLIDRIGGGTPAAGTNLQLAPLLLVDGEKVTSDTQGLSGVTVTAEVVEEVKGPKITILRYKNKSGYRKRQGHRQKHTRVRITAIDS
ncbi:50S ribosomal protein L21 [Pseudokineococcus sp. 1T1Z-3]|uniref:50S ribosomal protein L21 n=1 Tax=Pseudokineococcus sp. 1T1Z-3 TaxID=3132745 RepID=UPI0030B09526